MIIHLHNLWGELGSDGTIRYWTKDAKGNRIDFNDFVGKKLTLRDTGKRVCWVCGQNADQLYQKGTCEKCFRTSPRCDICMVKPELCHFEQGTCRDKEFAAQWCFNNQVVYFSLTSNAKVGYLSLENKPQRWIDQGATAAIEVAVAHSRFEAGQIEVYLANFIKDKTNWREMLQGESPKDIDLLELKKHWAPKVESRWPGRASSNDKIWQLRYPVTAYPPKVISTTFNNSAEISGVLRGVRGQYLIFQDKVFSIRKHEGYVLEITVEEPTFHERAEQGSLF